MHGFREDETAMTHHDDILDDLFHGCAFAAYVELAIATGGPPESEATRRLAFRYYEEELKRKIKLDRRPTKQSDGAPLANSSEGAHG